MKCEWEKYGLGSLMTFKNGKKRPEIGTLFPVYGGNGILGYADKWNNENCVIVGRVGAYCGSVFREKGKCWISDNAISGISDDNSVDYLYYLLKSLRLNERHIGTSQPLLTQEILNNIQVSIPHCATQQKIASILASFDDKIKLNAQINHNLEEQIEAVFEDLFINSPQIDHWEQGTIANLGKVIGGSTPSKAKPEYYTFDGIAWITPKDLSSTKTKFISKGELDITPLGLKNSSAVIMPRGTVLFSSRAPIGYIAIAKSEVTTNQGFKSVVPYPHIGTAFVYCFLKHNLSKIESMASGSTFKEVSGSVMKAIPAIIPDSKTLAQFSTLTQPLFEQQELLEAENQELTQLRDTLLPKLMSGEIDVSQVEV